MKTFKILGLLLTYPEGTLYSISDEMLEILNHEKILPVKYIKQIESFLISQKSQNLMLSQENYVATFDRGRAHSLHLFEHIHGESRDRGQAMVNLCETYETKGLYIESSELPDYLPLFMEYLSRCDIAEANELLGEAIDVIAVIGSKLKNSKSPYAAIFKSIEALSSIKPDSLRIEKALQEAPKDPETLNELDEEWEEKEAFSGNPNQDLDCGSCNAFPNATEALEKMKRG